jgi:hypothetical protein
MRSAVALMLAAVALIGCASQQQGPTPLDEPFGTPPPVLPLPANLTGIPTDEEFTANIAPHTPAGELNVGESGNFQLGHCGLMSPIDIDGSLWDPIGYHLPNGGQLTDVQEGELINSTPTVVRLAAADTLELLTPSGMTVVLNRHDGPRDYFLCD